MQEQRGPVRLIASDMDGTIVGAGNSISDRTVRAFQACRDAGIDVVFVTGRPPRWLDPLRERIGHTGTVICSNGAITYDLGAGKVLASSLLPLAQMFSAAEVIRDLFPAVTFAAETVDGIHLEPGFSDTGSTEILGGIVPRPLHESLNGQAGVAKFLARASGISPDEFLHRVAPAVSSLVATTHSAPTMPLLEMSLPGLNKAVTLADYAAQKGITAEETVAFGDMPNDIQMLDWAGHGYAMASGHAAARAAADFTAPAFNDDGVAVILERLLGDRAGAAEAGVR
ncbi:HAD family hydrolase [Arthrobacter sp. zg-Y40]|uniref:HAD family hydrolase n=1 Tax=unclassified Arthrobacter TaxID=235627 RepID=UPI001D149BDD|nr:MULTISPECIES: HAD family hydrolase [unclassified Arthrobacter]MCC3275824.1 HAD family hydrolase [Arthrobacter sp. zg-Y20]MCC3278751.1 HAD family hydrolase [Arthrobacter sp. zg-Y40]MDK1315981.1 HAD family hydrolase [Arthrobacter sp. zg.Y20]WIB06242.1 HAD family hydrolase [Arthrobacter sp. zg-Y20]